MAKQPSFKYTVRYAEREGYEGIIWQIPNIITFVSLVILSELDVYSFRTSHAFRVVVYSPTAMDFDERSPYSVLFNDRLGESQLASLFTKLKRTRNSKLDPEASVILPELFEVSERPLVEAWLQHYAVQTLTRGNKEKREEW